MALGLEGGAYVRTLSAVYAAMFLIRLAFGVSVVTFGEYLGDVSDFYYSLVVSASPAAELVTVIFAGFFIDRYGRKGVLLTGLGLGAVSLYGLALTRNEWLLAAINALHGAAAGLILVTTLAIIATYSPPAHRGREMGIFNLSNIFGWIAGFVLGSLMLGAFEGRLQYTFIISGALATAGLIFADRMIQFPPRTTETGAPAGRLDLSELLRAVSSPTVILLNIPWLIVFILVASLITFFFRDTGALDVPGGQTALAIAGIGVLVVLSQVLWGRLADKFGRESIMLVGAIGFTALMGVIVYAFFEVGSAAPEVIFENVVSHWFILTVLVFIALAFAPAGLAALADEAKEGAQGTTMSAYSLTLSLGFIVGPPIVATIRERFGGAGMVLFFAAAALALLAVVLTRFLQVRVLKRDPLATEEGA